jgi:L-aminoadipate-semialdehyde dehydrogenase
MNRMPLYHFATTDLPADTIAPEMDDRNAATALRSDEDDICHISWAFGF